MTRFAARVNVVEDGTQRFGIVALILGGGLGGFHEVGRLRVPLVAAAVGGEPLAEFGEDDGVGFSGRGIADFQRQFRVDERAIDREHQWRETGGGFADGFWFLGRPAHFLRR